MGKDGDISVMNAQLPNHENRLSIGCDRGRLNILECNKRMFLESIESDFTFKLNLLGPEGQSGEYNLEVKAHRYILRARSQKFEDIVSQQDCIVVKAGVGKDSLDKFVWYLYTDELALSEENVYSILELAKDFQIHTLVDGCFEFLSNHIRSDNVCQIYDMARGYNQSELTGYCLRQILANPVSILASPLFLEMSADSVESILTLDELCVDEAFVYETVVKWADLRFNRNQQTMPAEETPTHRSILGKLLYAVRFPLLGATFVSAKVLRDGLLSADEITELFQLYLGDGSVRTTSGIFTVRGRGALASAGHDYQTVCRFKEIHNHQDSKGWPCNGSHDDAIALECNQQIFVLGIGIYGPRFEKSGFYNGSVEILVQSRVIQEAPVQCEIRKSLIPFAVMFPKPVKICPHHRFDIRLKMRGPETYYGTTFFRRHNEDIVGSFHPSCPYSQEDTDVPSTYTTLPTPDEKECIIEMVGGIKFKFYNSLFSQNDTSVDQGQIPEIFFTNCTGNPDPA